MTIFIYYTFFSKPIPEEKCDSILKLLCEADRNKHDRYKRWEDKTAFLIGRLNLIKGCKDLGFEFDLRSMNVPNFTKPSASGLFFNISHTENIALVAISKDTDIGIDIEKVSEINLNDFKSIFTEIEFNAILKDSKPQEKFYEMWTSKEAIIKGDGRGLSLDLRKLEIKDNRCDIGNETWFLFSIEISHGYKCFLAAKQKENEIKLICNDIILDE